MKFMAKLFWNADESRVRALWRLIGFFVIFSVILLIVGILSQMITGQTAPAGEPITLPMYAVTLMSLLAVWLAGRFLDRRRFAEFGFLFNKQWWIDFVAGLILSAALMLIIFLIELAAGWITITGAFVTSRAGDAFSTAILAVLVRFIFVGIYEELVFRGYLLTNLAESFNGKRISPRWAIIIATLLSSMLFGLAHASNPHATLLSTFNILLAGIFMALAYLLTGQLAIPIALHISWNFFQGNVFGFPVSGTSANQTSFIAITQGGPELWTGGAFGPEAGLLGFITTVLGCILIVWWVRWRYGRVSLHTAIAEPPISTVDKAA